MNTSEKKLVIVLMILTIVFTIMGGTLAYFNWQSSEVQKTNVTFTVASGFSCSADGGGSINNNSGTLAPAHCTNSTYAIQRTIKANVVNNRGANIYLDMWLNVNSIDSGLANSANFKYALTTDPESCTTDVVSEGTFKGTKANDKVYILEDKSYPTTTNNDTFYLYVWLDAAETSSSTMNQNFSLTLGGSCTDKKPKFENKPVLDTGMIPVKISDTGVVTAVSEDDDTWYDYSNQEWANAILVKETGVKTRSANKNDLTTINSSDILAYYVWIPRYSYKIWTLDASSDHTGDEQTIDIKFVNKNTKDAGTSVGDYYTHPAFTFGSQELDGLWLGKFEMSHDTLASSSVSNDLGCTNTTCTNANGLRILPTVSSLRYNSVSNMYYATRSMEQSNNVFGITNSDSHMMKNSEWGAVAYLSHSNYGINTEIRKNNYRKYFGSYYKTSTGCGANVANANTTTIVTTCAIPYGIVSGETFVYPQSTTGNISGIFDMSGGAGEYVMGNYDGTIGSSGFTTMPDSKYYDNYPSSIFTGNYSTNM
ncbi:MAG: hypothetical protein IJH34_11220, partial [Romboutsia sp.]|nr:hypothetical protein [Romboutsia sp.]